MIAGPKPITMTDKKFFPVTFKFFRLIINRDIQFFLKIISHPHIMIAYKKMHRDTHI